MDYANARLLQFRLGGLDQKEKTGLPVTERKMHIRTGMIEAAYYRTHIVRECEMYKQEGDVLKEIRVTLDGSV